MNTFLISFDAKTAKPDAATIMPDGGPRVLPWEDFERSCLSEIMSRLGQAGAHASWDGISVEDYEERCEAVSKWMYKYWEDMAPADRDARKVAASEQMTKQWEDMAPADRDARNVVVSEQMTKQ